MKLFINTEILNEAVKGQQMLRNDLAEKSGVSKDTISHLFNCKYKRVYDLTAEALAAAVGLGLDDLAASETEVETYLEELTAGKAAGIVNKHVLREIRNIKKVLPHERKQA